MTTPLLQAKDLRISFYGVQAADGVNLEIREGEFLAIIGPNGSGKTTFLNLCTGYLRPSSGEVYLDGKPITAMAPRTIARRGIARAFQIPQLFLDQTVLDNLMIAVAAKRGIWVPFKALGAEGRRQEAEELLALVGLDREAGQLAGTLPEGRRKLLDIVIALALKPRLVLLDEPTSGVSTIGHSFSPVPTPTSTDAARPAPCAANRTAAPAATAGSMSKRSSATCPSTVVSTIQPRTGTGPRRRPSRIAKAASASDVATMTMFR